MPPTVSPVLTPGEKRIMDVLWRRSSANVHDVQADLKSETDLAYNTVLSMLRTMTDKGYVGYRKQGRAFVYFPVISENQARDQAITTLISRFFNDSPSAFAQHLIKESEIDGEDLDALMKKIGKAGEAERHG